MHYDIDKGDKTRQKLYFSDEGNEECLKAFNAKTVFNETVRLVDSLRCASPDSLSHSHIGNHRTDYDALPSKNLTPLFSSEHA